jgi:5-methyltetrahydrofolate--homocysteine methyltransferase
VIETDTFRANRLTLADYGLEDRTLELNTAAATLARRTADRYSTPEKPRFVAGSIGPSGKLISTNDPQMSDISYDALAEVFREQAQGLIQGGADLLLLETQQDIVEVKAAIEGIRRAFAQENVILPIQAQVTLDTAISLATMRGSIMPVAILEGMVMATKGVKKVTIPAIPLLATPMA